MAEVGVTSNVPVETVREVMVMLPTVAESVVATRSVAGLVAQSSVSA